MVRAMSSQPPGTRRSQAIVEQASTENLRIALHRYRSFFQRLLSL
jgi:hypothetical protein